MLMHKDHQGGRLFEQFEGDGYNCAGCPNMGGSCYDDGEWDCIIVKGGNER